jgi:hypothetical protein
MSLFENYLSNSKGYGGNHHQFLLPITEGRAREFHRERQRGVVAGVYCKKKHSKFSSKARNTSSIMQLMFGAKGSFFFRPAKLFSKVHHLFTSVVKKIRTLLQVFVCKFFSL